MRPRIRRCGADGGSATIVMVGVIVVLLGLCAALAAFARVSTDAERVRLAADQAALAGASVVLGAAGVAGSSVAGTPCDAARTTAERNGAELATCRELSTGVQVETRRPTILNYDVSATARAGEGPQSADHAAPDTEDGALDPGEAGPRASPAPITTPVRPREASGPSASSDARHPGRAPSSEAGA